LASRSTTRSWLPARRLGADVLRLRDGSLRAVLECSTPPAVPGRLLGDLQALQQATQIVVRARRPSVGDGTTALVRLRASHASLMSRLAGSDTAVVRRLLVVVPCDAEDNAGEPPLVNARVAEVHRALERAALDPVRLAGSGLDDIAALDGVQEGRCEVRIGHRLVRTLIITRLPERLRIDALDAVGCEHDLSLHVRPNGRPDQAEVSAYVSIWAETRDALDVATERAEALLAADGLRARRPYLQAEPALVSALPLGLDLAGARRVLTGDRLHGTGPSASHRNSECALFYGIDPGTRQPRLLDRLALTNPNAVVLGDQEARSRLLNLELVRARLAGRHVHLIGTDSAYQKAVEALDGRVVAPVAFDPFSVTGQEESLEARTQALLAAIDLMAGGLSPAALVAVEDAVAFSYAAHGFSYEDNHADLTPPTLDEIGTALLRRGTTASDCSQAEINAVAARLQRYVTGGGRRLLELRQAPPLGPLSVHDLARLPEEDRPVGALLSLDRVWRSGSHGRPSLVGLDEAHRALSGIASQNVSRLMTTARERQVGLTLATDDISKLLQPSVREVALGAGLTVLLRQTPEDVERVAAAYRLTPAEQSWLLRASRDEGLLITADRRFAFRAIASDEEERLITGGNS
jgi:hypothetical protein